jgi:hypothetical protein
MARIRADDGVYPLVSRRRRWSQQRAPLAQLLHPQSWALSRQIDCTSYSDPEPGALRDAGGEPRETGANHRVGRLDAFGVTGDC